MSEGSIPDGEEFKRLAMRDPQRAVELVVQQLLGALVRYFAARVGSYQEAEDLAQETLIQVLAKLDRYDPGHPVRAWVFMLAKSQLQRHRQDFARNRDALEKALAPDPQCASNERRWNETERREHIQRLSQALARLDAAARELLLLRALGVSAADIARERGLNAEAVRQAHRRLLHALRAQLE